MDDRTPGYAVKQLWTCNGCRPPNEGHHKDASANEFQGISEKKDESNHWNEDALKIQVGAFSITRDQKSDEK